MAARKTTFLMGLLFASVGAAAMAGSVLLWRSDTAFFAAATETTATVVDTTRISRAHKRDRMHVRYAFEAGGVTVEEVAPWRGSTEAFRALSEGSGITIAYIANDDPTRVKSRLVTGGRQGFMGSILVIGGVFFVVGGLLTLKSRRG